MSFKLWYISSKEYSNALKSGEFFDTEILVGKNPNTNKLTTITTDYDIADPKDNPFTSFPRSIEAAYFWLGGSFPQRDTWDLTSIDIITIMASFLLAIVKRKLKAGRCGFAFLGGTGFL